MTVRKPRRRGVSLIEMIVVISLLTTLMVFVGRMMFGLFQAEQASTRDVLLDRRLSKLALQFREDVHSAETVTVTDQLQLRCSGPGDAIITYTASEGRIERAVSNSRHLPEQYNLPGSRPVFNADRESVELKLTHSLPQVTYTPHARHAAGTISIRAVLRRYGNGATP
jgi:prepilin-type N-terminal cleavage/methylation domain-containing protein